MNSVAGYLYKTITNDLQKHTVNVLSALSGAVGEIIWWVVYFYFLFAFFSLMTGRLKDPKQTAISALLVTIFYSVISDGAFFYNYLCLPFKEVAENVSAILIGQTSGGYATDIESLFVQLDNACGVIGGAILDLTPEGGWLKDTLHIIKVTIGLGILSLAFLTVYIAFFVMLSIAMFSMHMLFMLGPLFIFFAAFEQTRGLCWGWVKAQLTFVLLIIFTTLAVSICLENFTETAEMFARTQSTDEIFNLRYFAALCWSLLSLAMLLKAPDLAASLTGGQAGSTAGIAAGISTAGALATGGMTAAGGAAGGLALKGAGKGASAAGKGLGSVAGKAKEWWGSGDKPSR